jgi:hypothetical protein
MKNLLAVVGALISTFATVPYIIDIIRKRTKPNIVTWLTWSLLTGVATAAAYAAHQPNTGLLLLGVTICTAAVVLLGIKYGTAKFTWFDALCQLGAVAGLILWLVFNSPSIAIVATVTIDFIGALPTLVHAYKKPGEETWQTFAIGVIAPLFTIASLSSFTIASVLYPAYIAGADGAILAVLVIRRRQIGMNFWGKPHTPRKWKRHVRARRVLS